MRWPAVPAWSVRECGFMLGTVGFLVVACGGKIEGGTQGTSGGGGRGRACSPAGFDCPPATTPTDTDGDGCWDTCIANNCPPFSACPPGTIGADTDGDGCLDRCVKSKTAACPPFQGSCPSGSKPVDLHGDGCINGCGPSKCSPLPVACPAGTIPVDTDGDGCVDSCRPR